MVRVSCAILLCAPAACGPADTRVFVRVPGGLDRAVEIEVSVLHACEEIDELGDPPRATLRRVEVMGGQTSPIGALASGRYALYGRAWQRGCELYAAGCAPIDVDAGGGIVQVELELIHSRGCDPGRTCSGGLCQPATGDAGLDAGPDAEADAGCQELPPAVVGSFTMNGAAEGLAVSGDLAAAAWGDQGLVLLDLAEPTVPVLHDRHQTLAPARSVALAPPVAWVAVAFAGIEAVDVSNPNDPALLGFRGLGGDPSSVALTQIEGVPHALVAARQGGLHVLDVSTPDSPEHRATRYPPENAYAVAAAGTSAFVADDADGLRVVDLADPDDPEVVSTTPLPGAARGVVLRDPYAYVAAGAGGLVVIDVGDRRSPRVVGSLEEGLSGARGVVVSGTTALVAIGQANDLGIVDVADPGSPAVLATVDMAVDGYAGAVSSSGRRAFVADGDLGFVVIDLRCFAP